MTATHTSLALNADRTEAPVTVTNAGNLTAFSNNASGYLCNGYWYPYYQPWSPWGQTWVD